MDEDYRRVEAYNKKTMRSPVRFAFLISLVPALVFAQTQKTTFEKWTGTLISSDCSDMRFASSGEAEGLPTSTPQAPSSTTTTKPKSETKKTAAAAKPKNVVMPEAPAGCEPTMSTTSFALIVPEGKMMKIDASGGAKIAEQLRTNAKLKRLVEKKVVIRLTVTGTMEAERIRVNSLNF